MHRVWEFSGITIIELFGVSSQNKFSLNYGVWIWSDNLYGRLLEEGYIEQAEPEKHRVEQVC